MGRSIVLPKTSNNNNQLRKSIRRGFQALLAVACTTPLCLDSAALAQLRTGREAPRDYYPQATSAKVPQSSNNPLREDIIREKPARGKPAQEKRTSEAAPTAPKSQRNLESISDDPPSQDLPRLSSNGQAESLPKVLAANATSNRPSLNQPLLKQPVVTEVSQADFETPSLDQSRSDSGSPQRSITLASHPAATRQVPANPGNVIKRVTPARVVSEESNAAQPPATSRVIDPIEPQADTYSSSIDPPHTDDYSEGYIVDDPMGYPNTHSTCGDPACSECGPGYPTLNIRIGFPPLLRCDRLTARIEAATFWPSAQAIPSLVRSAEPPDGTDLFGGTVGMDQSVQGMRGEFGWKFGIGACNSLQFRFFDAGAQSLTFDSLVNTATPIVRPYIDGSGTTPQQGSVSVREPGFSTGDLLAHAYSDVQGGDVLLKGLWLKNCDSTTEWLVGYQNARLTDSIDVHSTTIPVGSTNLLELRDQFRTVNQFNGATLGLSRILYSPRWSLGSMFKLGMGDLQRDVTISGFQKVGTAQPTTNGLLARSPANGVYSTNTFAFSPEVNVTLGYRLTRNIEATLGYNYLGLPKVARAGQQIDTVSDLDSANPTRPRFILQESNFSLHSLNYGLQYRY